MRLCLTRECCVDEDEVSRVLNRVSPVLLAVSRSKLREDVSRDVEASRNALVKVLGGARALRSRVKNLKSLREVDDVETIVNTFVNTLNRVVEVRNLLQRMKEVAEDSGEQELAQRIREAMAYLSALAIEFSAVALRAIHELKELGRDDCGKLASAIGTAIFAALLDADTEVVRQALAKCFPGAP